MNTLTFELNYELERGEDECYDLLIEYGMSRYFPAQTYGPPEKCYPAEGGEIEFLFAWLGKDEFVLTDKEQDAIEKNINEHHDYDGGDYD